MSHVFMRKCTLSPGSSSQSVYYIKWKSRRSDGKGNVNSRTCLWSLFGSRFPSPNRSSCATMVRHYKPKTEGPSYSQEELDQAVEKIKCEKWSYRRASSHFNVPLGTLSSHVRANPYKNAGHPPALSMSEEQYLVKLITTLQEWGQLSSCADVLRYADEYVTLLNLECRFTEKGPTKDWYYGFIKRWNNDLKLMKSTSLESSRATGVSHDIVNGWFSKLHDVLKKLDLLDKPQNIFNTDESGFCEEAGSRVVLVKRDSKYAHQ